MLKDTSEFLECSGNEVTSMGAGNRLSACSRRRHPDTAISSLNPYASVRLKAHPNAKVVFTGW